MNTAWQALLQTSPLEIAAIIAGLVYVVLIARRNRWGWVAGALSSSIYVWLAARAQLPMQSLLQGYYVVMAVYGWYSWSRNASAQAGRIYRWPWRRHLLAVGVIVLASALSARWLASETQAAWPLIDSLCTGISLLATWMVARSVLENWLYWIAADTLAVFLFLQQSHPFTAGLFVCYMIVAAFGFHAWLQRYRRQQT